MRKINTGSFVRATRGTPRAVNRQILLNLVREHEPISRADLARRMELARGVPRVARTKLPVLIFRICGVAGQRCRIRAHIAPSLTLFSGAGRASGTHAACGCVNERPAAFCSEPYSVDHPPGSRSRPCPS